MRGEVSVVKEEFEKLVSPWNRATPQRLFHYTGLENFKKILSTRTLRLYDILEWEDDPEEFRYPLRTIWGAMQPYWKDLIVHFTDLFNPDRRVSLDRAFNVCAACCCEAEESEFMWRSTYGRSCQGVSIVLNGPEFCAQPKEFAVYPMAYNETEFLEILAKLFGFILQRGWVSAFNFEEGLTVACRACEILLHFLVRMKRPQYDPEREWRVLKLGVALGYEIDEKRKHFVNLPLKTEYVGGVILGSECPFDETDLSRLLDGAGFNIPFVRSRVTR